MKLVALAATLLALLVPASSLASAPEVIPNRYCEWGGYSGIGVTVFGATGYVFTCRIEIPGTKGKTVIVYSNHTGV